MYVGINNEDADFSTDEKGLYRDENWAWRLLIFIMNKGEWDRVRESAERKLIFGTLA